jgi:hypothetical protein
MIYYKLVDDSDIDIDILLKLCKIAEPENVEARIWNINWKRKVNIKELVVEALSSSNLKFPAIKNILIGRLQPYDRSPIHIDQALGIEKENNEIVFNIPLTPNPLSTMEWHTPNRWGAYQESFASYNNPHKVRLYTEENSRLASSISLTQTFYARTDVPHRLVNNTGSVLYAMSLRFFENPDVGILKKIKADERLAGCLRS